MDAMHRIGIVLGREDAPSMANGQAARDIISQNGALPLLASGHPSIQSEDFYASVNVVVAIGGDGTILAAARRAAIYDVPVLGVNLGKLGFLNELEPENLREGLLRVLKGEYRTEARMMLKAQANGEEAIALNDMVMSNRQRGRVVRAATYIDGVLADASAADGVLVSSPTGSTAYSLSCGGPILPPNMDAMLVAAVCPHSLYHRHMVVGGDGVIEVLAHLEEDGLVVFADGREEMRVAAGERVRICRAELSAQLIRLEDTNFYARVRSKLGGPAL